MIKLPHKKSQSHGGVRGDDLDTRSSQFEGLFGRLFRSLPAASWSEEALRRLTLGCNQSTDPNCSKSQIDGMTAEPETVVGTDRHGNKRFLPRAPKEEDVDGRSSRLHDDEENSGIDAGYTYLGQFIDHDITFDPASSLQKRNDVNALVDYRTPRLDLDSVYGRGPDDQPYIYESNGLYFQLGRKLFDGNNDLIGHDLPRHSWREDDGREFHRALIGDKRNDENVIICQLHVIFLKFHNRFVSDFIKREGDREFLDNPGHFLHSCNAKYAGIINMLCFTIFFTKLQKRR